MGTGIALPDKDVLLILGILAVLYREGSNKELLIGLLFLLISIMR